MLEFGVTIKMAQYYVLRFYLQYVMVVLPGGIYIY